MGTNIENATTGKYAENGGEPTCSMFLTFAIIMLRIAAMLELIVCRDIQECRCSFALRNVLPSLGY